MFLSVINLAENRTVQVFEQHSHDEVIVIESSSASSHLKWVHSHNVDCASVGGMRKQTLYKYSNDVYYCNDVIICEIVKIHNVT